MSQYANDSRTFSAEEAIGDNIRVKLGTASQQVLIAGADEIEIGVTDGAAAINMPVKVRFKTAGTVRCTASAAVTTNTSIYATAAGKVDDSGAGSGSSAIGVALEAALATGDVIECILNPAVV